VLGVPTMNKKVWIYLLAALLIATILSWLALLSRPANNLKIIACDVGQGDGILITKGSFQMLIDGGPGKKIASCLGRYIPFWDRKLEAVVLTHPDADHVTGLVDVFQAYSVGSFLTSGVDNETEVYKALVNQIALKKPDIIYARSGQAFKVGELGFEILSPTSSMLINIDPEKANNYSVVVKLTYGKFDALFTGDIEDEISDKLADNYNFNAVEYLEVPHHGSKNGLSEKLLLEVNPQIAVISVGKNNRFGHPSQEVLDILKNTKTLRTDQLGDIVVESDGEKWWLN